MKEYIKPIINIELLISESNIASNDRIACYSCLAGTNAQSRPIIECISSGFTDAEGKVIPAGSKVLWDCMDLFDQDVFCDEKGTVPASSCE